MSTSAKQDENINISMNNKNNDYLSSKLLDFNSNTYSINAPDADKNNFNLFEDKNLHNNQTNSSRFYIINDNYFSRITSSKAFNIANNNIIINNNNNQNFKVKINSILPTVWNNQAKENFSNLNSQSVQNQSLNEDLSCFANFNQREFFYSKSKPSYSDKVVFDTSNVKNNFIENDEELNMFYGTKPCSNDVQDQSKII